MLSTPPTPGHGASKMFLISSRMLRVSGLAVAMVAFGFPPPLIADPVQTHGRLAARTEAREPFGVAASLPSGGGVLAKWLAVWHRWNYEKRILSACSDNRAECADPAALAFLAIVDKAKPLKGRARLGEINRAINLAIKPVSDLAAHGSGDVWSSPLATLTNHMGDCEDYAIAKFAALLEAGISSEEIRLLVIHDSARSEDHAVVVARDLDQWLVLDNRRMAMLADTQLANYSPLLQLDGGGVRRYADVALVSVEQGSSPLPAAEPGAIAQ